VFRGPDGMARRRCRNPSHFAACHVQRYSFQKNPLDHREDPLDQAESVTVTAEGAAEGAVSAAGDFFFGYRYVTVTNAISLKDRA
jgi:hypothetical protein